jgi:hypothetical protein
LLKMLRRLEPPQVSALFPSQSIEQPVFPKVEVDMIVFPQ